MTIHEGITFTQTVLLDMKDPSSMQKNHSVTMLNVNSSIPVSTRKSCLPISKKINPLPITKHSGVCFLLPNTLDSSASHSRKTSTSALPKESVFYFSEAKDGKNIKHKVDLNSPRTQEIAASLGYTLQDCVQHPRSEFFLPNVPSRIAKMRFESHYKKVQEALRNIHKQRKDLERKQEEKHRVASLFSLKTNGEFSKWAAMEHYLDDSKIKSGRMIQSQSNHKVIVPHRTKKEMKDFVEQAWKDAMLIESQEAIIQSQKKKPENKNKKSNFLPEKPSPILGIRPATSQPKQQNRSNILITEVKLKEKEKVFNKTHSSKEEFDVIKLRIQQQQEIEERKKKIEDLEFAKANDCLINIENKIAMATMKSINEVHQGYMTASRMNNKSERITIRSREMKEKLKSKYEAQTIETADKILKCRKSREQKFDEIIKTRKMETLSKKEKRDKAYRTHMENYFKNLQRKEEERLQKAQETQMDFDTPEKFLSMNEFSVLTKEMQKANKQREMRKKEYARTKILKKHELLQKRNAEKKDLYIRYHNCKLNSRVSEHQAMVLATQFMKNLSTKNISDKTQRKKLLEQLQTLNSEFDLKANFSSLQNSSKKNQLTLPSDS